MFWPLKCHILSFKTMLLDNSASFTLSSMKHLCQKWKVELIFRGAWNSLMAWPDWPWPPHILRQIYATTPLVQKMTSPLCSLNKLPAPKVSGVGTGGSGGSMNRGPPSSWSPRVVGHWKILGKTLRKIIKLLPSDDGF